jgi:hypothetical protein
LIRASHLGWEFVFLAARERRFLVSKSSSAWLSGGGWRHLCAAPALRDGLVRHASEPGGFGRVCRVGLAPLVSSHGGLAISIYDWRAFVPMIAALVAP